MNSFSIRVVTQNPNPGSNPYPQPPPHTGRATREGEGEGWDFGSDREVGAPRDQPTTKRSSRGKRYKPKGNCLKIRCHFEDEQGGTREIVALVDTGAEINLVRSSLLPREVTHTVYPPSHSQPPTRVAYREGIGKRRASSIFRGGIPVLTKNKN